jgi:probable HAF family extracellular repeat protein
MRTRDEAVRGLIRNPVWGTVARIAPKPGAILGLLAICAAALPAPAGASAITDLGTLPGGRDAYADSINASGAVAGYSGVGPPTVSHAFYWTRAGGMVDLGTLGGERSYGHALNDSGQVVGNSEVPAGEYEYFISHAFSWTQAGGMVDLGTLGGKRSAAAAVNDAGEVVGYAELPEKGFERTTHAFIWTARTGMVDIGTLGGAYSEARAINTAGEVVGSSQTSGGETHAFSWTPEGGMKDLGAFPGYHYSAAKFVNDAGDIAGAAIDGPQETAFFMAPEDALVDLGTLDGSAFSEARGMSSAGEVVGYSWWPTVATTNHAFSWTPETGMVDLGTLGGNESEAKAVDGAGAVVGESGTGECVFYCIKHAFVWTPDAGMFDLGTLGGNFSDAVAINESGEAVGYAQAGEEREDAVLWNLKAGPSVTGVSPTAGLARGGTAVTITGEHLGGATAVTFGKVKATSFHVVSETEIDATAPPGTGTVEAFVTTPEGKGDAGPADRFHYLPPPQVISVAPDRGPSAGGTTVTITGERLAGATSVMFGAAAAASFKVVSATELEAVSPPGAGLVEVTVTTPEGESEPSGESWFSYGPPPAVEGLSRKSGPASGGTAVTIKGTEFAADAHVYFGSIPAAQVTVNSSRSITAVSPASTARTVDVIVTTGGGTSALTSRDHFRFGPPTVSGVSPASGGVAGGGEVVLTGSGFGLGSEATAVKFGSTAATTVNCTSTTTCRVTVPSHKPGAVAVRAAVGGRRSPKDSPADEYIYQ